MDIFANSVVRSPNFIKSNAACVPKDVGSCFLPFLQLVVLLVVLPSTCVARSGARVDSCCTTQQCHPKCAAAASGRAELPLQPSARRDVKSMCLLQSNVVQRRKNNNTEEEEEDNNEQQPEEKLIVAEGKEEKTTEENKTVEEMGEEGGQQQARQDGSLEARASQTPLGDQNIVNGATAGGSADADTMSVMSRAASHRQQPARRRSLLGTAALKLIRTSGNQSDNKTDRGLQEASQVQVSSRGFTFETIPTTAFHFSSGRSRHNMWMRLQQMRLSSWVLMLSAALLVVILACVWFSAHNFNPSSTWLTQSRNDAQGVTADSFLCHSPLRGSTEHFSRGFQIGGYAHAIVSTPTVRSRGARECLEAAPSPPPSSPHHHHHDTTTTHHPPPTPTSALYLCDQLVVPQSRECFIYVPTHPENSFHVMDKQGNPVIGVELKPDEDAVQERRRIELFTREGVPAARCMPVVSSSGGEEFQLFHGNGVLFATLFPSGPAEVPELRSQTSLEGPRAAWTLQTQSGSVWFFHGNFDSHIVEVTDPMNRVLALSSPDEPTWRMDRHYDAGKFYSVRVAPMMDVSIVLCGLQAIHHQRSVG